jgi:thioredoxin 1
MTNALPGPVPLCCPQGDGGDLLPLLGVLAAVFVVHLILQAYRQRKGKPEMKNFKNLATVAAVHRGGSCFCAQAQQAKPAASARRLWPRNAPPRCPASALCWNWRDKCTACKMMTPIIADLQTTYAGQLQVDFIDVWKDPDAAKRHDVRIIPMQIFFGADGRELFRHEGFFAKEDILAKWQELGVELP